MSQENDRQLPDGWQWVKLGDVCRDVSDGSHFTPTYIEEGIPFLSVKNIRETGINFDDCKFICEEEHKKLCKRCKPEKGDVLYTKVGTTGIAKAIDINREFSIFVSVALLKLKSEVIPEYLEKVLNAPICKKQAESLTQGAANRNLVIKDLKCIEIPLPPLSEQKRIAAILNEQMEAVEKARKATEAQLEAAKALPAAYLRAVFESEEANSWERRKLGDIARLISGGTPSRNNSSSFKGTIAWVKTLDLNCEVVKETEEYISETAFDEIRGEMLPVGSVMIAMYGGGGTIGKSGILGLPAVTNQAICSILPNYNVFIPEFLHAWVLNFRPKWMGYSSGNRRDPNIKKGVISNIECPFPTVEKQKQIASTLTEQMQEVERLKQNLKEQLDTINKLPAVLLRRAFKGEL